MNNPPAFPGNVAVIEAADGSVPSGMSLRDYFAAKAMQSFLDKVTDEHLVKHGSTIIAQVAESSYDVADLMLEARNKQI